MIGFLQITSSKGYSYSYLLFYSILLEKKRSRFSNALLSFLDINECDTNPCENGGQCTNSEGSFTCSCAGGWRGPACNQGKFSEYIIRYKSTAKRNIIMYMYHDDRKTLTQIEVYV